MSKFIAVQLTKLYPDAPEPKVATAGSVCFDLSAHRIVNITERTADAPAAMVIGTGLKFRFDEGYQLKVFSRSGHGFKHGIRLANGTGVIDQDYDDELMIKLVRDFNDPQTVEAWNVLVDKIKTGKQPRVAQAQMQEAFRVLFLSPQTQQEHSQAAANAPVDSAQPAKPGVRNGGLGSTGDDSQQADSPAATSATPAIAE